MGVVYFAEDQQLKLSSLAGKLYRIIGFFCWDFLSKPENQLIFIDL